MKIILPETRSQAAENQMCEPFLVSARRTLDGALDQIDASKSAICPARQHPLHDLLAHPLDTYEFTRTLGNTVEDLLTPGRLTAAPTEKERQEMRKADLSLLLSLTNLV